MPIIDIEDYSKLEVNVQFIFSKIAQLFTETTLQFIIFIYVPIIVIIIIITIIALQGIYFLTVQSIQLDIIRIT